MEKKGKNRQGLTGIAAVLLLFPEVSQAYLDPGFWAMAWQFVAAALFGAALFVKALWRAIERRPQKTKKG